MNASLEGFLAFIDTYFLTSLLSGNALFYLFCSLITNTQEHLYY